MQAVDIPQAYHSQKACENNYIREAYNYKTGKNFDSYIDKVEVLDLQNVLSSFITYNYLEKLQLIIPKKLEFLKDVYKKSEYILGLERDWDDNNAEPYSFDTWSKALSFLNLFATTIFNDFNKKIISPKIYHGPSQSIDILIENNNYSLLINLPHNSNRAVYFGKDKDGNYSKGEINIDKINYSLNPLAFNF